MQALRNLALGLSAIVVLCLVAPPANAGPTATAQAQRRLNHLGCDAGPVDGQLGAHTRSAVIRFQSRVGLLQSGSFNKPTRTRLYADDAPRCDVRPVPARSGHGRRIVISQAENWVWLVGPRDGVVAQGGMVDNPDVLRPGSHATGSYCGRGAPTVAVPVPPPRVPASQSSSRI